MQSNGYISTLQVDAGGLKGRLVFSNKAFLRYLATLTVRDRETFDEKRESTGNAGLQYTLLTKIRQAPGGAGVLIIIYARSRIIIDIRTPTVPGRSTSGFHRLGRHRWRRRHWQGGGGVVIIMHRHGRVTLEALQCRDGTRRVFTVHADRHR